MTEPTITIGGVFLTHSQAMTVRIALESFAADLADVGSLGDDAHGLSMRTGYLEAIRGIRSLIYKNVRTMQDD
jgi:hypothetical protein